jgi:hypothetical protein
MVSISQFAVRRFKRASNIDFALGDVNVLVGGNNSGKSSAIQGLHFAITLFQSIALAGRWQRTKRTTIAPEELIYSPANDPYRLYETGQLQQGTFIDFEITLDDGRLIQVDLTKGKNANLSVLVAPIEPAQKISSLVNPFSVYSPGLAGIARREQFVSDGVLLRAVSRGDANLFLRNIIYRLFQKTAEWDALVRDLKTLFGEVDIDVAFNEASGESIIVDSVFGERHIPLESCGTGLLQAIQILTYVHFFRPAIMILDEPDSHLHPNNQRLLCDLLVYITKEYGCKVILTTHSRHVLDALRGRAQLIWVQNGSATPATADDHVDVLMDLGALDIREIAQIPKRVFFLTEDKAVRTVSNILISNGFEEDDFRVLSYFGVTEPHKLKVVVDVIRELQPEAMVIVHRDRDFLKSAEVETWSERVRAIQAEPFVTSQRDIEDYLVEPAFLAEKNPNLTEIEAGGLLARACEQLAATAVEDYVNGRVDIERQINPREVNPGAIAREAAELVARNPREAIKGKQLRATMRRIFQAETGRNLLDGGTSDHLRDARLRALSGRIRRR